MSWHCSTCRDSRVYLDVVIARPNCGDRLRPRHGSALSDRVTTEIHVHNSRPVARPPTNPLPWLAGALLILVLAAMLVREPI